MRPNPVPASSRRRFDGWSGFRSRSGWPVSLVTSRECAASVRAYRASVRGFRLRDPCAADRGEENTEKLRNLGGCWEDLNLGPFANYVIRVFLEVRLYQSGSVTNNLRG